MGGKLHCISGDGESVLSSLGGREVCWCWLKGRGHRIGFSGAEDHLGEDPRREGFSVCDSGGCRCRHDCLVVESGTDRTFYQKHKRMPF